ncbi:hypothetical protein GUITHDRAFT_122181 [Guillardia theta CCMP2712]|uniref:Uncharacterized protein n=2 Tax=Guillardia theta TaxID=55529 RepID=L1I5W2_GUITC|nr:hypothetical protein GUITHDRAFT_122181 [Guillardia theta CCMP2712]EKX31636.1 hypothetical protein GUITHDRAFT_122181 [Guillardia theta CCMP2712]|mmetsp:Transcript_5277/g.18737  ORF Transcript_5277/g.18737 Transcript_5277/m.18737 type:complete len:288 (+) Transcript_5277:407-1270(+)|eukprot:XP_005818616.1 hypothetical protein GUITHDRAFT_122181 [Guillardia theta CCMP2712]
MNRVSSHLEGPSASDGGSIYEKDSDAGKEIEDALSALAKTAGVSEEALSLLRQAVQTSNIQHSVPSDRAASNMSTEIGGSRRPFKPASSKRQQLTAEEAVEIYKLRPIACKGGNLRRGSMLHCKAVAPRYGVTPKTIRDVWSGRSWAEATRHLWTEDEVMRRTAGGSDEDAEGPSKKSEAAARSDAAVHSPRRLEGSQDMQLPVLQPSVITPCDARGTLLANPLLLSLALYKANCTGQAMPATLFQQQSLQSLLPLQMSLNASLPSSSSPLALSYSLGLLASRAPFN